jgi:hypothetical protein
MKNTRIKAFSAAAIATAAAISLSACGGNPPSSQEANQKVTEQYSQKLTNAEAYPLSQMNDSAERANLREKLLRLNDPNKIGYVYEMTQNGQIIASYTVKGKVSSNSSQLTNTQNINTGYTGNPVTESMGDDGSYGPSEPGVFFFTTTGQMITWNGLYQYSDAPVTLTSKPLITMDANAQPSSTAGQLKTSK